MAAPTIKLPSELFALAESLHFEGSFELDALDIGPDTYTFEGPVAWDVTVTDTGGAMLVQGSAQVDATTSCSRCLSAVPVGLAGDIEGYFLFGDDRPDDLGEGEDAVGDDEFDVLPDDHVINLEPLIKAALIMAAPTTPLCRPDCAGLCPKCGANLNEGGCGCDLSDDEFEEAKNPFSVLKQIRFDE